jgi:hypothetical protein
MRFHNSLPAQYQGEQSMKMKLASVLAVIVLGLAGCGGSSNTSNSTNSTNASNANKAANSTSSTTTPKADENMVKANAEATDDVGGTKEGCKCSAAGMKCATKAGEKGCCGKDGECSTMVDGKSSCCAGKGSEDKACCSVAAKMGMKDDKNACNPGEKPATAPAGKKS